MSAPSTSTSPRTTSDELPVQAPARDIGLLLLRVVPALGVGAHGAFKLADPAGESGLFTAMGFPAPEALTVVVGLTEVVIALLLLAGALTTLAGAGVVGLMVVAIWRVHGQFGFRFDAGAQPDAVAPVPGYEYSLALLLLALAVVAAGPGRFALEGSLAGRLPARFRDVLAGGTTTSVAVAAALGIGGGTVAALVLR